MPTIDLKIAQDGKASQTIPLPQGVFPVGSESSNKIILSDSLISWRHAIISHSGEGIFVEDLGSATGTYIDGERVNGRIQLLPGQNLQIGTFSISHGEAAQVQQIPHPPQPIPQPKTAPAPAPPQPKQPNVKHYTPPTPSERSAPSSSSSKATPHTKTSVVDPRIIEIKKQIHGELLNRLDIRRMTVNQVTESDLQSRARHTVAQIISDVSDRLPADINPNQLGKEICEEALGLGPLEDLLADDSITEIMVNGPNRIYIEQAGRLTLTDRFFVDENSVLAIIERIVSPIGRRIDESSPYVDARLHDGSRVNAVIAPLSLSGPCITIRKFAKEPFTVDKLIEMGSITREIATFMAGCVQLRKNIIVAGGTGTGKTTMLNVVSNYLPDHERIVTIEDAAELRLRQDHVITLEARPANMEGKGAITIRDLVRNSLRMRPDRIVVGECRGGESLDMLQAMNTGHDGSLTTVHANSPRDVVSRLETMVLMSGMELPVRAIREQIGGAIQVILHLARMSDGTRRVNKVTEVCGMEGEQVTMQDLWEFRQEGIGENGHVIGQIHPTGAVPTFMEEFTLRGIPMDKTMFAGAGGMLGSL